MKTLLSLLVAALLTAGMGAAPPASAGSNGYAYTLNNDGIQNAVVVLSRNDDGALTEAAGSPVATGGRGLVVPAGGDFDAQGSVRVHGKYVLAVNPGSNTIAVLLIDGGRLTPVDGSPFAAGGVTPLSVTAHGDLVYVANQAIPFMNPNASPNVTGFRMSAEAASRPFRGRPSSSRPARACPGRVQPERRRPGRDRRLPDRRTHPHLRCPAGRPAGGRPGLALRHAGDQRDGRLLVERRRPAALRVELPGQRGDGLQRQCDDRGARAGGARLSERRRRGLLDRALTRCTRSTPATSSATASARSRSGPTGPCPCSAPSRVATRWRPTPRTSKSRPTASISTRSAHRAARRRVRDRRRPAAARAARRGVALPGDVRAVDHGPGRQVVAC